jgi:hypothetical protein
MKRSLTRLAALGLAIPFAVGALAGSAEAQDYSVTIPGCYGASNAIVCEPTFTATTPTAGFYVYYVTACAGQCYDIPVTMAGTSGSAQVCYSYKDRAGNPAGGACTNTITGIGIGSTVTLEELLATLLVPFCSSAVCAHR